MSKRSSISSCTLDNDNLDDNGSAEDPIARKISNNRSSCVDVTNASIQQVADLSSLTIFLLIFFHFFFVGRRNSLYDRNVRCACNKSFRDDIPVEHYQGQVVCSVKCFKSGI